MGRLYLSPPHMSGAEPELVQEAVGALTCRLALPSAELVDDEQVLAGVEERHEVDRLEDEPDLAAAQQSKLGLLTKSGYSRKVENSTFAAGCCQTNSNQSQFATKYQR